MDRRPSDHQRSVAAGYSLRPGASRACCDSDSKSNSYSYGYSDANGNSNGNRYANCHGYGYRHFHAETYAYPAVRAHTQASPDLSASAVTLG